MIAPPTVPYHPKVKSVNFPLKNIPLSTCPSVKPKSAFTNKVMKPVFMMEARAILAVMDSIVSDTKG